MGDKSLVSVIIPAFNAEPFIGEAIESILSQSYRKTEVIVIDDGSTDCTREVALRYRPKVQYYYQENSGGCASPRNRGLERCSGDFICFLDADDLMVPDRIAMQVDFMDRHRDVGLVFSDYRNFDKNGVFLESHFQTCPCLLSMLKNQEDMILEKPCVFLAQENFGIASSFMMRREMLDAVGGFDSSLKSSEDFQFYYRVARGTRVGIVNKVGLLRRLHASNMSSNLERMMIEGIRSYSMVRREESDKEARRFLDQRIACFLSDLARLKANSGKFSEAILYELRAFSADVCLVRVLLFVKNFTRGLAIALGVHKPQE